MNMKKIYNTILAALPALAALSGLTACDDDPVLPPLPAPSDPVASLYQDWDESTKIADFIKQGWNVVNPEGDLSGWYIRDFNGQNYATVSSYLGTENGGPYENWLISPPVNLDESPEKTLTFTTQAAYKAEGCSLEVYILDRWPLSSAKKVKLEAAIAEPPASGYSSWVKSGVIDLSAYSGVVYIGWCYRAEKGGGNNSTTYCVDNVNIGGASDLPPGTVYRSLRSDDSEDPGWTYENVKLPQNVTNVWSWTNHSGNWYLNATTNNRKQEALAYAISPVIELPADKTLTLTFSHAARYQTTLQELCGVVIRESGATEWIELPVPTWPSAGSWTFVSSGDIDITPWAGKSVQIAFKYGADSRGADQWEVNNLAIKAN